MEKKVLIGHLKTDILNEIYSEVITKEHSYFVKNYREIDNDNIEFYLIDDSSVKLKYKDIHFVYSKKTIPNKGF